MDGPSEFKESKTCLHFVEEGAYVSLGLPAPLKNLLKVGVGGRWYPLRLFVVASCALARIADRSQGDFTLQAWFKTTKADSSDIMGLYGSFHSIRFVCPACLCTLLSG